MLPGGHCAGLSFLQLWRRDVDFVGRSQESGERRKACNLELEGWDLEFETSYLLSPASSPLSGNHRKLKLGDVLEGLLHMLFDLCNQSFLVQADGFSANAKLSCNVL